MYRWIYRRKVGQDDIDTRSRKVVISFGVAEARTWPFREEVTLGKSFSEYRGGGSHGSASPSNVWLAGGVPRWPQSKNV